MTDTFNFFDYNFSGLISIFAALVGMAYPLIHQAIQRVDEMYDSTLLAGYAQRQSPIKRFNVVLIIAIVFALTIPFLLKLYNGNEVVCLCLSLAHSLVTLILLLSVVLLYHFLQTAIRPSDMLKYVITHPDGGKPEGSLLYVSQMAKFASARNDRNLFLDATSHIAHVMLMMRRNNQTFETFPPAARETLLELAQYYAQKPTGLLSHSTLLCSIYFDIDGYYPFSDGEFGYIWKTLDLVLQTGNESFITSYWTFADQYYRFVVRGYYSQHYEDADVRRYHISFMEFHTMIGSLLVFNKRYGLLKKIMYFSNEEPPSYQLVPSSFDDIHSSLVTFCQQSQYPFGLAHRYLMIGMSSDVNCDNEILATAYRYHAILMVRLYTINDYFVYSRSKEVPEVTATKIEDIEKDIQITNRLLAYVKEYYETGILKESLPIVPKQEDVEALIGQYLTKCNDKIKDIKNTHEIDYKKISYIKENMIRAAQGSLHIPSAADVTIGDEKSVTLAPNIEWSFPIDSDIVETGTYTNASNLPELIVEHLNSMLWNAYNSIFIRTRPVAEFSIDFRDVKRALDRLGVDSGYSVISLGVYFGTFDELYGKEGDAFEWKDGGKVYYHGASFYNVPSASQSLIVLKKDDVPYHTIDANTEAELHELGEGLGLYSNLDRIQKIDEDQIILTTKRCVSLHYKARIRYIRLNIQHYSDKHWDIDRITTTAWNNNPYENIEKLEKMNTEELMKEIFSCFPGHSDHSIKEGHMIMPQHVMVKYLISPMQAKELLQQLCDAGFLLYDGGNETKVAGYHLTEAGYRLYTQM